MRRLSTIRSEANGEESHDETAVQFRLYYRPEDTPKGRDPLHGADEVLASRRYALVYFLSFLLKINKCCGVLQPRPLLPGSTAHAAPPFSAGHALSIPMHADVRYLCDVINTLTLKESNLTVVYFYREDFNSSSR